MEIYFFLLLSVLWIVGVWLKYGLTGKSFKFYLYWFVFLVTPIIAIIVSDSIQNDFLKVFLWIPVNLFLLWIALWLIKYLQNSKDTDTNDS